MSRIELKNICKNFGSKKVLQDVNLSINSGEFVTFFGPSGCGKSTTLKIIAGIEKPISGDVLIDGQSILNIPMEKRKTVIVFQEHLLFPHMNVEENIEFGLKMCGVDKALRKQKVSEIIELIELHGNEKKYPKELSGGQRQRVAIGRAIAVEPRVLLLDEPFSSLDMHLRDTMRELISELQRTLKITTILVTHDREEAFMLSSRVAIMLNGFIHQYDTPQKLYDKPSSIKVANFLGKKITSKVRYRTRFLCVN
ncbi:ABC transporter ATP-binding protein [Clostridium sp. DJ247]|uniref:ABC transporter ATP-binding protein n=1 Tax=Clostridium sp. DJ247 TaxID=2726188 RepID=UPI001F4D1EE8|nr:ABC transporter ATP-binding protein [Clostridium sp. DJ247]